MVTALSDIRHAPFKLAGVDGVLGPFVRQVVDEQRRIPAITRNAKPQVAYGESGIVKARIGVGVWHRFKLVHGVAVVGPLGTNISTVLALHDVPVVFSPR